MRERLAKAGYPRLEDIAFIKPTDFENFGTPCALSDAPLDRPFLAEVTCEEQKAVGRWPRQTLLVAASDDTARLCIRLHNFNAGLRSMLAPGQQVRVYGQAVTEGSINLQADIELVHPRLLSVNDPLPEHLIPVYPAIGRLAPQRLQRSVSIAVEFVSRTYPDLPSETRTNSATLPLPETLRLFHTPRPEEAELQAEAVMHSLKHDEWLAHMIFQQHKKMQLQRRQAAAIPSQPEHDIQHFEQYFDFKFTADQCKAMLEIAADIAQPVAMRRLVHGDVGCGKTLVAAFGCWLAARNKQRCAIMCPTVILASQHHARLRPVYAKLGINCVLLLGSMRAKERREAIATVTAEPNSVIIGTHALFQEKTQLPELQLAVIDEQHRFGVAQRKALERKGGGAHVLMLSATPIPRTLELGMLSHLEVTKIVERPQKGEIRTLLFSAERSNEVLARIIDQGLQAYWICPLIKKSAKSNLRAAEEEFARISKFAPQLNPTLIHGQLDNTAKLDAMRSFEQGTTRLLIATTVVEVGVDAPEADVIVIDHCERLGLSQLHQLRGRVGRGKKTGFCALLYDPGLSEKAQVRLQTMHETTDGFEISKADLKLRGPGDIVGKRQSGMPKYRFADFDDEPLMIEQAKETAQWLLEHEPTAAEEHYRLWLGATKVAPKKKSAVRR